MEFTEKLDEWVAENLVFDDNETRELLIEWMIRYEEVILPMVLNDLEVLRYITWKWKFKIQTFHQWFFKEEEISSFLDDIHAGKPEAVRLFHYFYWCEKDNVDILSDECLSKTAEIIRNNDINKDTYGIRVSWEFVLAFCGFIIIDDFYLIYDPIEFSPKKLNEKRSNYEITNDYIGTSILGAVLGIPGIGFLAKWEERDEEKNHYRLFKSYDSKREMISRIFSLSDDLEDKRLDLTFDMEKEYIKGIDY